MKLKNLFIIVSFLLIVSSAKAEVSDDYQKDNDKDYLNDAWEKILGTDFNNPDTDGDLYLDGTEIAAGFSPLDRRPIRWSKKITIDLKTQSLSYFMNDILLEKFLISSGKTNTPTPKGSYQVIAKVPVKTYGGGDFNFYYPNTKWNLHFHTIKYRYYIHGAYWHDNFGQPMSSGCINVSYSNMERLYWWAQKGTPIEIK